jgi:hypothetical protein
MRLPETANAASAWLIVQQGSARSRAAANERLPHRGKGQHRSGGPVAFVVAFYM